MLIRLVATSALKEGRGQGLGTKVNRWDPEVQHRGLGVAKSWEDQGQRTPFDKSANANFFLLVLEEMYLLAEEQQGCRWLVQLSATCHPEGAEPNAVARTGTCPGGGQSFSETVQLPAGSSHLRPCFCSTLGKKKIHSQCRLDGGGAGDVRMETGWQPSGVQKKRMLKAGSRSAYLESWHSQGL